MRAKRSKSGAVSFDVLETEATHAPVQSVSSPRHDVALIVSR
jgi:hypothetical protein